MARLGHGLRGEAVTWISARLRRRPAVGGTPRNDTKFLRDWIVAVRWARGLLVVRARVRARVPAGSEPASVIRPVAGRGAAVALVRAPTHILPTIASRRAMRFSIGGWVEKSFAMPPPPENGFAIIMCAVVGWAVTIGMRLV